MQLNAEKRFGKGLAVLASYTFSKKMDDYGWTTPNDRGFDYGLSREDVPHNLKFSNVWQVPHIGVDGVVGTLVNGWMVNSMVTWQSGFPFTVSSGRDNSFTGINRDRADFLGGNADLGSDRPHGEMVAQYFDTSKFVAERARDLWQLRQEHAAGSQVFQYGRRAAEGHECHGQDRPAVSGRVLQHLQQRQLQRAEQQPSSAQFGRITSALDPRILQFGVKLLF